MKKICRSFAVVLLSITISQSSYAQQFNKITQNVGGNILRIKKANGDDVVGNPYLLDVWTVGNVKFTDSTYAANKELKYDILENLLVVRGDGDVENTFKDPVSEFTLSVPGKVRLFKNGFTGVSNISHETFFEVLYNGKFKLLKREVKSIVESKGYNTATVTRKIEGVTTYYIAKPDNSVVLVKNNEKSILAAMGKPELSQYVKENKLNLKNEEDIIKLLTYFSSL